MKRKTCPLPRARATFKNKKLIPYRIFWAIPCGLLGPQSMSLSNTPQQNPTVSINGGPSSCRSDRERLQNKK